MIKPQFDVVIVGSGPAGVSAAYPLINAGLKVAIIDGALEKGENEKLDDFSDINLTEASNAYELFKKNSSLFNHTYRLLKIKSKIEIIQILSTGGLSAFWHGISDFFSQSELETVGLPADEIQSEYEKISAQIKMGPKPSLDIHNKLILESAKDKDSLSSIIYPLPSASKYISSLSIDSFRKNKNFTYIPNQLVHKVKDRLGFVEIETISLDQSLKYNLTARFLILAAGSLNTTRIILRSLNLFNYKTTFLTKAHYVIVCLHLKALFKKKDFNKKDLGQLAMSSKETERGLSKFFVQLFRFNPWAINKAAKYIPIPKLIATPLIKAVAPFLVMADIRFPAFESEGKFCQLRKDSNNKDTLEIQFRETQEELKDHQKELEKIKQQLRSLGLFPLKIGSDYVTAHYAGGVPFDDNKKKLSVARSGKLNYSKRIYIADSSTWRALPGKSPVLTIMANASRIGKNVLKELQ